MKRILMLFAALAFPLAFACNDSAPTALDPQIEDIPAAEIVAASHFSDLTEDQKAALRAAFQEAERALAAIRASFRAGEITAEQARARAREVHEQLLAKIATILTPEQLEAFKNRQQEHQRHPVDLQLTEEQKAQIQALREEYNAFVESLRAQVHAGTLSGEEARAQLRAKSREFNARFCAILNAEQRSKLPACAAG